MKPWDHHEVGLAFVLVEIEVIVSGRREDAVAEWWARCCVQRDAIHVSPSLTVKELSPVQSRGPGTIVRLLRTALGDQSAVGKVCFLQ